MDTVGHLNSAKRCSKMEVLRTSRSCEKMTASWKPRKRCKRFPGGVGKMSVSLSLHDDVERRRRTLPSGEDVEGLTTADAHIRAQDLATAAVMTVGIRHPEIKGNAQATGLMHGMREEAVLIGHHQCLMVKTRRTLSNRLHSMRRLDQLMAKGIHFPFMHRRSLMVLHPQVSFRASCHLHHLRLDSSLGDTSHLHLPTILDRSRRCLQT